MLGRFDTILWDVDGTLLDFEASETVSIRRCLQDQGAEANDMQLKLYREINARYWQMLERGEITREKLYTARFEEWFAAVGIRGVDAARMNEEYQVALGDTPVLMEDAIEILTALKPHVRQYAASNGSTVAQENKLRKSGLLSLLDGAFISEKLGVNKPEKRFFDLCAAQIPSFDPDRAVIIGDSLTSDMRGGNNAGMICVWFNPARTPNAADTRVDAEIRALSEIPAVLKRLSM